MRINMFGASGSGCTTISQALARQLDYPVFDSDFYFWEQTDPPFVKQRTREEMVRLLRKALEGHDNWIISGSITNWDSGLEDQLSLAIFVEIPFDLRMARLQERAVNRYGSRVEEGGDLYESQQEFLDWNKHYDIGDKPGRSRGKHEAWYKALTCSKMIIHNTSSVNEMLSIITNDPAFKATKNS